MKRARGVTLVGIGLLAPLMAMAEESAASPTDVAQSSSPASTSSPAPSPLAAAVQARTPEEEAKQSGFQFVTELEHDLGAGTFVDTRLYSSLSGSLSIAPRYLFAIGQQRLVASATLKGGYEYTLPDSETGRRWAIDDIKVGVSAPAVFKEQALTNIAFSPSIGLTIPTSLESWNAGLITSISVGVAMSRSIGIVDLKANIGGSRSFFARAFNGYRNPNVDGTGQTPRDANGNLMAVCRVGELSCATGGSNPAWSLSAGGQVQLRVTGSFLLYLGYSYSRSWRYAITDQIDEYTPKALDSKGDPVAKVGLGQRDRTSSYFGASYQLNEHYSIDVGASTIQAPLTPTGQVRFPFLSLGTWADNATSLFFTLSAAY